MDADPTVESDSESHVDALSRLQKALEKHGALHPEDKADGKVFHCHICSYAGTSRFHFNSHMSTRFDFRWVEKETKGYKKKKIFHIKI